MKNFILVMLCSFFIGHFTSLISYSQVQQAWLKTYNGPGNSDDHSYSIAVDRLGYVYVTGSSTGNSSGFDITTIKYNSSGVEQWTRRYNGPGNGEDYAQSIAVDQSGNVYVTGWSTGIGTLTDFTTIKYNSLGDTLWVKRYNGSGNDYDRAYSLVLDYEGNVCVTGYSISSSTSHDYTTIKYNSSGDTIWVRKYNGPFNSADYAKSIAVDLNNNVFVTGYDVSSGGGHDYATVKYNSLGVQQWVRRYNGPGNTVDDASSVVVDKSGYIIITGSSNGSGTGADYFTIKYNTAGDTLWTKRYNGTGNGTDNANSIAVDTAGNAYVTGNSSGNGTGNDFVTIKYNSSGDTLWVKRYNSGGNVSDISKSVAVNKFGNVFVTGYIIGSGTSYDFTTIKYNSSGTQKWIQFYNGPINGGDYSNCIVTDTLDNAYVTGYCSMSSGGYDFATIKYSPVSNIKILPGEVPDKYYLYQNYPNPFNPDTKIKFDIVPLLRGVGEARGVLTTLKVYDILGKEITTLVNEFLQPRTYEVDWDGNSYSSGIYFYKLTSGEFSETKKMILIK